MRDRRTDDGGDAGRPWRRRRRDRPSEARVDAGEWHGYHSVTLGWYESELIRRTDPQHRIIGGYFADEIAAPLGLDLCIGLLDEVRDERLARIMAGTG